MLDWCSTGATIGEGSRLLQSACCGNCLRLTEEYDIQLYLKRSKWSRPLFGDEDFHHDRIAQLSGYATAMN